MRVVRRAVPHLQGKGLWQKVKFAKQRALYNRSAGAVFVMDSEGNHRGRLAELSRGRDAAYSEFPMAVGVAHPCVEAWLLVDSLAIARGLGLSNSVVVPSNPERLPAPQANRAHNPKTVLARCAGKIGDLFEGSHPDRPCDHRSRGLEESLPGGIRALCSGDRRANRTLIVSPIEQPFRSPIGLRGYLPLGLVVRMLRRRPIAS